VGSGIHHRVGVLLPALLAAGGDLVPAPRVRRSRGVEPFDEAWLRNAVEEHFEEAGVDFERRVE
jgi:hypothetical protein